jgi:chromosome segregation protein
LTSEEHEREKGIVGHDAQVARAAEEVTRVGRRREVVATEHARAQEEETTTTARRDDATAAIVTQEAQQREAEGRLDDVLARLQAARESAEQRSRQVTESRTTQATLTERAVALEAEVGRLEEAARDLEARLAARQADVQRMHGRMDELHAAIREGGRLLDEDIRALETQKVEMRDLDEAVIALREQFGTRDQGIRGVRHGLERVRTEVMQAEVARATAASDMSHLASTCVEAVGLSIEDVVAAVAAMEAAGDLVAPARRVAAAAAAEEGDTDEDEIGGAVAASPSDADEIGAVEDGSPSTPDQVIANLRRKIERLGPVNMMAIEQFDDLEARHTFLTAQRKDLLDAISQTGEAIRKIDKTTRERFAEAFAAVNGHFEKTFTTLFGGGRAGLMLIDQENDQESGIDIIAQPPGKRLQNVQLLSGGEKALTAMALMFAIFKYRPSPFCLLDEIDAPLDDANIGRFVEMLRGMQQHTQFIIITHSRKTMEIADRLYGVTMEEPGVSKLISVQLN